MTATRVSAVVVCWNAARTLHACLDSLARERQAVPLEVVVVDNASDDGSPALVRESYPEALLVETGANLGFAAGCNRGRSAARAPFVLFLNPDAVLEPGAIGELLGVLEARPDAALAGPRTLNPDGTSQLSWGPDLTPLAEWRQRRRVRGVRARDPAVLASVEAESRRPAEPDWVSGSCLLARVEALDAVGGFDEGFFLYEEDADLCLRLRAAGWRILFHPGAVVTHQVGGSAAREPGRVSLDYHRSHLRYYRKHGGLGARALLRAWLAVASVGRWLTAGDAAGRRHARALAALALRG